ncbi:hypothetical protein NDU88_005551 [Pleurodeles waltl]|uniref:Uncharacterized protein n=1 Tax=Pleurodeles waltl TaxID=8319 RepID=A0AAV7N0J7_PLEWA|nr:hypothetical protein NDU88_005551 [Pleurodeles waltl]
MGGGTCQAGARRVTLQAGLGAQQTVTRRRGSGGIRWHPSNQARVLPVPRRGRCRLGSFDNFLFWTPALCDQRCCRPPNPRKKARSEESPASGPRMMKGPILQGLRGNPSSVVLQSASAAVNTGRLCPRGKQCTTVSYMVGLRSLGAANNKKEDLSKRKHDGLRVG